MEAVLMAVYFVTGKLGSGKTLAAVGKIRDALIAGRPVATNLNLRLDKLIGAQAKQTVVYRLPDKPTVSDMVAIGSGNKTYDEDKNGLIVLDECGTWFNSRDWQDKDRRPLIDWLLHARKLGWDIIFIIQDVSMIDKQARKSVGEFVVYCRRLDRMKYPFIDKLSKMITTKELPKAKVHMGIVKYGDLPTSLTVDRWYYLGRDLYPAYDTKQMFTDEYSHGIYQMLPPYHSHGRYAVKKDTRFYMRMTKIYLRRFSKVVILSGGILAGAAIAAVMQPEPVSYLPPVVNDSTFTESDVPKPTAIASEFGTDNKALTLFEKFSGFIVSGIAEDQNGKVIFAEIRSNKERYNLETLRSAGYVVRLVNRCEILIMSSDRSENVRLHTSYCPPDFKENIVPLFPSPNERYKQKLQSVTASERVLSRY